MRGIVENKEIFIINGSVDMESKEKHGPPSVGFSCPELDKSYILRFQCLVFFPAPLNPARFRPPLFKGFAKFLTQS